MYCGRPGESAAAIGQVRRMCAVENLDLYTSRSTAALLYSYHTPPRVQTSRAALISAGTTGSCCIGLRPNTHTHVAVFPLRVSGGWASVGFVDVGQGGLAVKASVNSWLLARARLAWRCLDPSGKSGGARRRQQHIIMSTPQSANAFRRACSVTAAHFVTLDFTELTDEKELWSRGFLLQDRLRGNSLKIFSLVELELGIVYITPRGTSLIRTSRSEALLADKIPVPVDLHDAALSPQTSFVEEAAAAEAEECSSGGGSSGGDGSADGGGGGGGRRRRRSSRESAAALGSALQHVRALSAEPTPESLGALQRTLHQLPSNDDGWLESFLALDGLQALLDVLAHSQQQQPPPMPPTPTRLPSSGLASPTSSLPSPASRGGSSSRGGSRGITPAGSARYHHGAAAEAAEAAERLQARCVNCLALLLRRRAALEALLAQPHAVTCLVAALDVASPDAQCRVADALLRIALAPKGVGLLLSSWDALRDAEADEAEPRLRHLVSLLHGCYSLELSLGLLRLLVVMLEGKRLRKFAPHFAPGRLGSQAEPSQGRHGAEVSSQDRIYVHLQHQPLIEPRGRTIHGTTVLNANGVREARVTGIW